MKALIEQILPTPDAEPRISTESRAEQKEKRAQRNMAGELPSPELVDVPYIRLRLLIKNESTIPGPFLSLAADPGAKSCMSMASPSLACDDEDRASSSLQLFLCTGEIPVPNCLSTACVNPGLDFTGDPFSPVWLLHS
jgi:hypothetical protein